ncbi:hypothetical protein D3227_10130 [Mesorhizobium waimense]|uniref:Uncharacterized protein n=1 Tax=Mesorhizobium waimense TaxID=1300307 RepID=A0A3A5KV19_9HYPH|nr:hypothetical protein [Mesorhizobium waimense]RJT40330.1 hypothetical protein D3227_10130 [Mesorhizobium waimense]
MKKLNVSFRNRLLILQYEYSDAVIGIAFFCAFALVRIIPFVQLQNNPIVATQRGMGVVEYIRLMPLNPKAAAGRGLYYTYDVRLEDSNALIFIDDDVGAPHPVGSVLPLERQHHKNGTDTYRLLSG